MSTVNFENLAPKKETPKESSEGASLNRVKPVKLNGKVRLRKKSAFSVLANSLVQEDMKVIKEHLIFDVAIPAFKEFVQDFIENGIDMALWGGSGRGRRYSSRGDVPYNSYFKSSASKRSSVRDRDRDEENLNYETFLYTNKDDAQKVLDEMLDLIDDYGEATVLEYYSTLKDVIADPETKRAIKTTHTDDKYGWREIDIRKPRPVRGGYVLDLPRARYLD